MARLLIGNSLRKYFERSSLVRTLLWWTEAALLGAFLLIARILPTDHNALSRVPHRPNLRRADVCNARFYTIGGSVEYRKDRLRGLRQIVLDVRIAINARHIGT